MPNQGGGDLRMRGELLRKVVEALEANARGELAERLEGAFEEPEVAMFQHRFNEALTQISARFEEYHTSSMELAVGLSECVQVLAQVRAGDLDASVSEETVASSDELVARLGTALNETIAAIRQQVDTIDRQQLVQPDDAAGNPSPDRSPASKSRAHPQRSG